MSHFRPRLRHLQLLHRIVLFLAIFYLLYKTSRYPVWWDDEELAIERKTKHLDVTKVVVALHVPATDAYQLLPTNLLLNVERQMLRETDTHGLKNSIYDSFLLMSDLEMNIGGFHLSDVLFETDHNWTATHPDFERYRQQKEFAGGSLDIHTLKEADEEKERKIQAHFDRHKYLPLLNRTWEMRPEREWYVFTPADAYVVWPTMLSFLNRYNPETPYFFGNPPHEGLKNPFGKGGTTFVLSVAAMRRLLVDKRKEFEARIPKVDDFKLGFDAVTAALSTELSLSINSTFPRFSGFTPNTIPYGPGVWCESIIALHGMRPDQQSGVWLFERHRIEQLQDASTCPLTFADLWHAFIQPEAMHASREDWDNLSGHETNRQWTLDGNAGDSSWESCREACNKNTECWQYSYTPLPGSNAKGVDGWKCNLSGALRYGMRKIPDKVKDDDGTVHLRKWRSGWRRDRFEAWMGTQNCPSCPRYD